MDLQALGGDEVALNSPLVAKSPYGDHPECLLPNSLAAPVDNSERAIVIWVASGIGILL